MLEILNNILLDKNDKDVKKEYNNAIDYIRD